MDIINENGKIIQHIPDAELDKYYDSLYCKACIAECEEDCYCDDEDDGELLGYVCLGCGNIQNTDNGFGCNRCTGHSLEPWYD